jgi:hypothetical protein
MVTAPDELVIEAVAIAAFEGTRFKQPIVMAIVCYCGDPKDGERVLSPLRSVGPPLADALRTMPYIRLQRRPPLNFDRALLGVKGMAKLAVHPRKEGSAYVHWKGSSLRELNDAAIETLVDIIGNAPRGWSIGVGHHIHGAISRVPPDQTAFVRRKGYSCFFEEDWYHPDEAATAMEWVDKSWSAIQPYASDGTYVNFLSAQTDAAVRATYGDNYRRLSMLKQKYDPANFFHHNRNIKPAA